MNKELLKRNEAEVVKQRNLQQSRLAHRIQAWRNLPPEQLSAIVNLHNISVDNCIQFIIWEVNNPLWDLACYFASKEKILSDVSIETLVVDYIIAILTYDEESEN